MEKKEDNSSIQEINQIINTIDNGKKSENSGNSIIDIAPTIKTPPSMKQVNNQEVQNPINNNGNDKNKESFENIDLTTVLSNLNINVNQGFGEMKKEITGMKNEVKEGITAMKNEVKEGITEMKNEVKEGITEMKNEVKEGITGMKNEISKSLDKVSKSIDNLGNSLYMTYYALLILIFAIGFSNLLLKKNN